MGVKWMNLAAAATSYPTDGRGAVTATSSSSGFADTKQWDNREAILMELIILPGAAATTVTLTSHDGSTDVLPLFTCAANTPASFDLHGLAFRGIKVVTTGAAGVGILKFDVGMETTYTAS